MSQRESLVDRADPAPRRAGSARRRRAQRRRIRHQRRTTPSRIPGLVGAALALVLGFAAGWWTPRLVAPAEAPSMDPARVPGLALSHASVIGTQWVAPAEVARLAGVVAGTPIAEVDPREVAARVASHPWVASARAATLAPGRLLVEVREYEALARTRIGGALWWVDVNGTSFALAGPRLRDREAPLPELRGASDVVAGEPNETLARGVALLALTESHQIHGVRAVELAEPSRPDRPALELEGPRGPVVALLGPEPDAALGRLAQLQQAGPAELAEATEIDVRFGAQAVLRSDPAASERPGEPGALGRRGVLGERSARARTGGGSLSVRGGAAAGREAPRG